MSSNNIKAQNHDVRRQLFLGITKKIKSTTTPSSSSSSSAATIAVSPSTSKRVGNSRRADLSSPTSSDSVSQFLLPSSSHTIPKSPRSKRISLKLFTPTSTFSTSGNSSMNIDNSTDGLRPPQFVKSDEHDLPPMTKLILHKKEDINDYDYHTFSSKHRLRTSKIKALEQAEVTMSLYFNFELNEGVEDVLNEDELNDVLICLPGLDREATKTTVEQYQHQFEQFKRREMK